MRVGFGGIRRLSACSCFPRDDTAGAVSPRNEYASLSFDRVLDLRHVLMREPGAQQDGLDSFLLHQSSRYLNGLPLIPHHYGVERVGVGLYDGSVFGWISVSCMGDNADLEHSNL
jgi:hypothetical protein